MKVGADSRGAQEDPSLEEESRLPVAVLGATGAVGQRLLALLDDHPWFEVQEVLASPKSAGRTLEQACCWLAPGEVPGGVRDLTVKAVGDSVESELCFSALDASVAREAELALAVAGKVVCSNAKSWRMDPRVPLIVPEVNADHLELLEYQMDWPGAILCNPNCATIGLCLALKPIYDRFGLEEVSVVSLQALSGAGTPTAGTLASLDNVQPHIPGEEAKLEEETFKILGDLEEEGAAIESAEFDLIAQCNRVPVSDGHTLCVTVELCEEADFDSMSRAWREFEGVPQELELPSAPMPVVQLHTDENSPQPRLHRDLGAGMAIHVGRLRQRGARRFTFTTLSHNTLRGAAGGALLLAELAMASGRLRL